MDERPQTETEELEAKLEGMQLEVERIRVLNNVQRDLSVALNLTDSLSDGIGLCLDAMLKTSRMDECGLYLFNKDGGMNLILPMGFSEEYIRDFSEYGPDSPMVTIVKGGSPIYTRVSEVGLDKAALTKEGIDAIAIIPIYHGDTLIGCMDAFSKTFESVPVYSKIALESISAQTGSAIGRLRVEESLKEAQIKFEELTASLPEGIFEMNTHGEFIFVNDAALEMFGYDSGEVSEINVLQTVSEKDQVRMEIDMGELFQGGPSEWHEYTGLKKDGTEFPIKTRSKAIFKGGNAVGLRGIVSDETEAKKIEVRLKRREKLDMNSALAKGIAHYFNNKLAIITGNAELMKDNLTAENVDLTRLIEWTRTIRTNSDELARHVSQIVAFSSTGKPCVEPINLYDVIGNTMDIIKGTVDEGIEISPMLWAERSHVAADLTQMTQAIMGIAINSVEAMPNGGKIEFELSNVQLDSVFCKGYNIQPGEYAAIKIRDNGDGIPSENWDKIFDPFFTTKDSNRGMGLSTAYGIIKNHAGAIDFDSIGGEGTEVSIYLPVLKEFKTSEQSEKYEGSGEGTGNILVIDDEEGVRKMIEDSLENKGYSVVSIGDGVEGLRYYSEHLNDIDVVIMDITMPRMNGPECYREIRKVNPDAKVLIITGHAGDGSVQELIEEGARGYIAKPFDLDVLVGEVSKAISDTD